MTDESHAKRLEELAYQQGRRDADVDTRLLSHEKRLNAINGSIERHAQNAAKLAAGLERTRESLESKIDSLIASQATHAALDAQRAQQQQQDGVSLVNARMFVIGVVTVVVMLTGVLVTLFTSIH